MKELKCLIVEDSQMMRQLLAYAASRIKGLNVVQACDGLDGLKKLSAQKFDVVMIDINMPLMDGLKLVKHIRSDAIHKDVPIMMVTTEGGSDDRERAMELGVNVYLTKPVNGPQVLDELRKLLNLDL